MVAKVRANVIPQQFGVPNGEALAPYAPDIYGTVGTLNFDGVTDVIGGASPIPGVNVRTALELLNPSLLIIELNAAQDQGIVPVTINVPAPLSCPSGTTPASR